MGTLSDAVEQCESVSVNEQARVVQQTTSVGVDLRQQLMMMMTTSSSISRQTRLLRRQRPSPVRCGSHNIHPFNGPLSGTTRVSRYQKGKTNLDFTAARGSEWQWHQLGHMQVCTSLQTDNHASTPPLSVL